MLNAPKRVNSSLIRKITFNICMPILLACISFVVLFLVIYSFVGNPLKYIDVLKTTTQSSEQVDLVTLYNIYDPAPEQEVPIVSDGQGSSQSGENGQDDTHFDGENADSITPGDELTDEYHSGANGQNGTTSGGQSNPSEPGGSGSATVDEDKIPISSIVFPTYNTKYAIFEVPKYNMVYDLYFGDSYAALEVGIGQSMGSFLPGYGGTTLLTVHNSRVRQFGSSKPLVKGDEIKITTNYGVYQYEVTSTEIMTVDRLYERSLVSEANNNLVLYTCYPLHQPSNATQRLVVYAKLVSGKMIAK